MGAIVTTIMGEEYMLPTSPQAGITIVAMIAKLTAKRAICLSRAVQASGSR